MRTHKGQAVLVSVFLHESASAYWSACAHADQKPPAFAGVALLPIVVEAQPFPGPLVRPDNDRILLTLSEEATQQAQRSLLRYRIAGVVRRVPSREAAAGQVTVVAVIRLPVSLPKGVIGAEAAFRRGTFATAEMTIDDPQGKVIAEQNGKLSWGARWWFAGGRHTRSLLLDDVLADFARVAADRAVQGLAKQPLAADSDAGNKR